MKKRLAVLIIILIVIFGGTFAWYALRNMMAKKFMANFTPPPVTVSATHAKTETWHPQLKSVGTLQAINGVQINAEVTGQVVEIKFESGQYVKKGQLLVRLDDSVDQQTLKRNLASLNLNTVNYHRQVALFKAGATSALSLDTENAKMLESRAEVDSTRASIDKKYIKAPFDGKLGIRQINLGEYISQGQAMVLLQSLDPLYVNFDLPEQFLKDIFVGQEVQIKTDADPGKVYSGKITAINSAIDVATRSIPVQATFPNNKLQLYPGLYADVSVIQPKKYDVITIPQTAINYSLYGDSVYLIKDSKDKSGKKIQIVKQQFIKVGDRRGTVIAIKSGLKAGDYVVTSGQIKLHEGSAVIVNNNVKLKELQ